MREQATLTEHTIRCAFWIGEVVFLRVAAERKAGMVTDVLVSPGEATYWVTWENAQASRHNGCELTTEYVPSFQ